MKKTTAYKLFKKFVSATDDYQNIKVKTYVCTRRQAEALVRKAARLYPISEGWANLIATPRKSRSERCNVGQGKFEYNTLWIKRYNPQRGTMSIWVEEVQLDI